MPVIISGSTGISGTDGSAGTPALQGTDTNTGMFFPAADQIAFAEGGVEAMRLDASGRVGIGTATPVRRLQVNGDVLLGGNPAAQWSGVTIADDIAVQSATPLINLVNAAGSTRFGYLYHTGSGGNIELLNQQAGAISFGTNNTERARINSGGQLFTTIDGTSNVMADYGCRAWVNFNGQGTVAIRGSGNVSSITDNSNGNYTVNLANAMPDTNYSFIGLIRKDNAIDGDLIAMNPFSSDTKTTTAVQVRTQFRGVSYGYFDPPEVNVAIFR